MTESATIDMEQSALGMTNFDHSIDTGLDDELRSSPGKVYARYPGWNFCARVWFQDDKFHAEVWCYGSIREVISAASLPELMDTVCEEYGSD